MLQRIRISSIFGGKQGSAYFAGKGQFLSSLAIDPDYPIDDSDTDSELAASGILRPTAMEKFSGSNVASAPLWILTNPKTSTIYVYLLNGKVISYSSSLDSETIVGTPTSGAGNGAEYYDNYHYFATPTDISRLGPMNGSPSIANNYWTSTLSKNALTNQTYPSIRGIAMPNHVMHRHLNSDSLFVCDVDSANKGEIHQIKTTKTTVEGDTDNGSTEDALDFDYGLWPTTVETYGTDIAIALIEGTNTTTKMKPAKLSFWDTSSASFSKITDVEFPDPIISALKNVNGVLHVFSGNATGGVRVSRFAGGYTFDEIFYDPDSYPPFQGAVDHLLNRLIWGAAITDPENAACVMALGSKKKEPPMGPQNILKATSAVSTNQMVTALKYALQASFSRPRPIVGWRNNSARGIDKVSTTYGVSSMKWKFPIGKLFKAAKMNIPFEVALGANMTVTVTFSVDDGASSESVTINNTNYPNSDRDVSLYPGIIGRRELTVTIRWSGAALCPIGLPIDIFVAV